MSALGGRWGLQRGGYRAGPVGCHRWREQGWSCSGGVPNYATGGGTVCWWDSLGPAGTEKEEWSHGVGALVRLPQGTRAGREGGYGARGDGGEGDMGRTGGYGGVVGWWGGGVYMMGDLEGGGEGSKKMSPRCGGGTWDGRV